MNAQNLQLLPDDAVRYTLSRAFTKAAHSGPPRGGQTLLSTHVCVYIYLYIYIYLCLYVFLNYTLKCLKKLKRGEYLKLEIIKYEYENTIEIKLFS